MEDHEASRRAALLSAAASALPFAAPLAPAGEASAQAAATGAGPGGTAPAGTSPVRVDTKGLTARIRFEQVVSGPLADVNGRYKLRVTELVLAPGGHVGEHNHVGPGIRQVTEGRMTYVLPDRTLPRSQRPPRQTPRRGSRPTAGWHIGLTAMVDVLD